MNATGTGPTGGSSWSPGSAQPPPGPTFLGPPPILLVDEDVLVTLLRLPELKLLIPAPATPPPDELPVPFLTCPPTMLILEPPSEPVSSCQSVEEAAVRGLMFSSKLVPTVGVSPSPKVVAICSTLSPAKTITLLNKASKIITDNFLIIIFFFVIRVFGKIRIL